MVTLGDMVKNGHFGRQPVISIYLHIHECKKLTKNTLMFFMNTLNLNICPIICLTYAQRFIK